jgi:hypothetical protein
METPKKENKTLKALEVISVLFFAFLFGYTTYEWIAGKLPFDSILSRYAVCFLFFWIYTVFSNQVIIKLENASIIERLKRITNMVDKLLLMGPPFGKTSVVEVQIPTAKDEDGNIVIDEKQAMGQLGEFLGMILGNAKDKNKNPEEMTLPELRSALEKALKMENYEAASMLQKLISEREEES